MNGMERCDFFLDVLYRSATYTNYEHIFIKHFLPELKEKESKEENGEIIHQVTDYMQVLNQILSHLEDVGYISIKEHTSYGNDGGKQITYRNKSYSLTVSGEIFISLGGYKGRLQRENQEKVSLAEFRERTHEIDESQTKLLASQTALQRYMLWVTIILALGGLIAAGYYCLEIWKFYHPVLVREYFPLSY